MERVKAFIATREWVIPLALALAFVAITLPGLEWGILGGWNPDEIIQRVINALHGRLVFDETDFNYPSLTKWVMYGLGKVVLSLGYGDWEVTWTARFLSVVLGASVIALTYALARRSGISPGFSLLAALLVMSNSVLANNARFAHNDIYLTLFVLLATWASFRFAQTSHRSWFYAACFFVGLAASSKYNGIAVLLLPIVLFFLIEAGNKTLKNWLRSTETLALGLILTASGYFVGTPKALFWMTFYFKRMIPELLSHAVYGLQPDSVVGVLGQWPTLGGVLGGPFSLLALTAFGYAVYKLVGRARQSGLPAVGEMLVIPLGLLAIDLPLSVSYLYISRYYLPFVPLLAVLAAQLAQTIYRWLDEQSRQREQWVLMLALAAVLAFSLLRVVGVVLLFTNDARIPAGEFIAQLPAGKSLEHTFYPPYMNRTEFSRQHNYPLYFIKDPGETPPTGGRLEFNTGAEGLDERQTDYLVVDSFTFKRFEDPYICNAIPVECEFFDDLLAGDTNYQLIGRFEYRLPAWIPRSPVSFLNPDILIFERFAD